MIAKTKGIVLALKRADFIGVIIREKPPMLAAFLRLSLPVRLLPVDPVIVN